jgi:protein arginine N-methyltransferase 5
LVCGFFSPARYESLDFHIEANCTIHGFSGTFHCDLYKDVAISIVPATYTQNMFSWFPLFIPLANPLKVSKGDVLTVNVWR